MWQLITLLTLLPLISGQYNTQIGNNALRTALNSALWEVLNNAEFTSQLTTKWLGSPVNFTTDCGASADGLYTYPVRPADGTLAKILDSGIALVGYGTDYAPYYFQNDTSYVGLSVDLTNAVLTRLGDHYGVSVTQQPVVRPHNINTYLVEDFNDFDFSARFLTNSIDRRQLAVWTCGFWPSHAKVAVNAPITFEELISGNYKFAIQSGSYYDTVRIANFPNSVPVYSQNSTATFTALASKADGVVATINDEAGLTYYLKNNANITILSPIIDTFYVSWQVRYERCSTENYGNSYLQSALNSALSSVDYSALYAKYSDYDLASYGFSFSCPLVNSSNFPTPLQHTSLGNITSLKAAYVGYATEVTFYYAGTPYTGFVPDLVNQVLGTLSSRYAVESNVTPSDTYLKSLSQVDFSARLLANSNSARNQLAAWTCNFWRFSYRVLSKNSTANETSDFNNANVKFSYLNGSLIYNVIKKNFPLAQTVVVSNNDAILNYVRDGTNGVTATVQDYAIIEKYVLSNPSSGLVQLPQEIGSDDIGFQIRYDSCDLGTYGATSTTGTTADSSATSLLLNSVVLVVLVALLL